MKLFFVLIAAFLVAGVSAQTAAPRNITAEILTALNDFETNANAFISDYIANIRGQVDLIQSLLLPAWNGLKLLLTSFLNILSPTYANLISTGIDATVQAFSNSFAETWLRNATNLYFGRARTVYRQTLQKYLSLNNTSNEIYQCWNASRRQIYQTLRTFFNDTSSQSRPFIREFKNVSSTAVNRVIANFTYYQLNAPICFYWFQPTRTRICRETYWNASSPAILAAIEEYRTTVINQRDITNQAVNNIIQTNAAIAEASLNATSTTFETCVNNTLTTLAP